MRSLSLYHGPERHLWVVHNEARLLLSDLEVCAQRKAPPWAHGPVSHHLPVSLLGMLLYVPDSQHSPVYEQRWPIYRG